MSVVMEEKPAIKQEVMEPVIKQEAMEVDSAEENKVDADSTSASEAAATVNENGDASLSAESDQKTAIKSSIFKVKVSGLPRFYPLWEFKKLVKEDLGLALSYVRSPKRGSPWLLLTFTTAVEQQKALKALHKYTWRKKVLSCNMLTTDAQKRKPEDGMGDDSDAKKAKLDLTVEERVLMLTIPYHNIPYEEQLKKKTEEVKPVVVRLGDLISNRNPQLAGWVEQQKEKNDGVPFQLDEIRLSPVIEAYRNKCEFRVGINPDTQERTVGCRLENFRDGTMGVGPAHALKHLPEQMREAVKLFEDYVRKSDYGPFIVEKNEGYWRHLMVRVTNNGDLMMVVVIHPQSLSDDELTKLKYDIKDYFVNKQGKLCNVTSLYFQPFTEKVAGVPLPAMEHLYGKTHLQEELFDLTFHLSPSSYFQVNTKGAEVLYSAIIDLVEPTEDTTILDLCCGTGGIGLCIARKVGQVFGIEYLTHNVDDAKLNAAKNEITNCEFIAGRVEDVLPTLRDKITGKTVVPILDPPRAGLSQKVLVELRKMENVQKMIYVCTDHKVPIRNFLDLCLPAGRSEMTGHPFIPTRVIPVDVAPFSMHCQMVILMERLDPSKCPASKNPPRTAQKKVRERVGRGMKGQSMVRGRGRARGIGLPLPIPRGRGRGMGMPMGGVRGPLIPPQRMGYMGPPAPPMGPPMREYGRPLIRPRGREMFMNDYRPGPMMENDYLPPMMDMYGPRRAPRLDFSADELTLSRYSDFRRDVEDAIDSSFSPRRPLLMSSPAVTAAAMLEREEMAYRAGLTRGLVGAATFGPPPSYYSPQPPQYGRHKVGGVNTGRGKKGIRRARGGRR
ncbi:tRNA (uracil-5-)-methyltransferase homolog B-like [Bacillus rossius redtenbacheri]|uniref:tRNA (uracil-5-)-methyltransferase homolog B-like n=1 Tax=Bacillus rossius redtenbacheri TaxID=93214 RepID=UPI002FDCAA8C